MEEHTLRLDRALQNDAFQTWRLAGRADGFVRRSTAVALPGVVPSVMSVGAAAASTTALDFLRTQASALRNHLQLGGSGRMFAFCVAPGTAAAVAAPGARVLLCEVAVAAAAEAATVRVAADVSLPPQGDDNESHGQRLVGDALDASVVVVDGGDTLALVSLGRGDLRAVRLTQRPVAGDTPPAPAPPLPSAALYPLRPAAPLSGVRPFVLAAAAVLPPKPADAQPGAAAAAGVRVRCVAWAVADHLPPAAAAAGAGAAAASASKSHHTRHVCELWSFELVVSGGDNDGVEPVSLVSRRRLLRSPAAPHAVQLLLPRLDAVLAAVQPQEEDDVVEDEDEDEEANDDQGGRREEAAAAATAAAARAPPAAAAAAASGDNNQAAKGDKDEDEDGDDMRPRTLRAAAAALAKFTSDAVDDEGGAGGGAASGGGGARPWAPPSADLLHETGADGEGDMGDEPQLVLRLVPCSRQAATPVTWRCGTHRLLSAEQVAMLAASSWPHPPPPLLAGLSDDVDCAVVMATLASDAAPTDPPVRVEHRATVPALAYVLAGKTQRRHLLLAGDVNINDGGGSVAAALVEGRRYAYLYGRVPEGASVGAQEVVDLLAAARGDGGEEEEQGQQQHIVLGARLVMAAPGDAASSSPPPRLLVLTDRSLLEFELR